MNLNTKRNNIVTAVKASLAAAVALTSASSMALDYKHVAVAPENMAQQKLQLRFLDHVLQGHTNTIILAFVVPLVGMGYV